MVKKIGLLIIVVFLIVAIPVTFFVLKQQQELRQKAAPATTMYLTPAQKTAQVGETFTLDININTGENSIVAASIHLTFDPAKLKAQSIVNSSQFPNILSSADTSQAGKVSIAVGSPSISQPFRGVGTMATVRFSVLQPSDTPVVINFGPESFAGSIGEGSTNALIGTTPANIIISSSGSTPTPTPTTSVGSTTPTPTSTPQNPNPTTTPTTRLSPTPTMISGQLSLTSHANGSSITQDPPTLSGTAPAGSTVTITFHPGSITGAVIANSSGNWSFTPSKTVGIGTYTITIASTNSVTGATQTITSTLTITSTSSTTTPTPTRVSTPTPTVSSETEIPLTGSSHMTYVLIIIGILFLVTGVVLPFGVKH
jgi:hypothetical protein